MAAQERNATLVLIPGMQCTAELWEAVAELLRRCHPIVQVEIRSPTVESAADVVLSAADGDLVLVGHSLGGVIALAATRLAPERVVALALVSVNLSAPTATQRAAWRAMERDALHGELDAQIERTVVPSTRPGEAASVAKSMASATGVDGLLLQLATQHSREDERPGFTRFTGPALMLGGRRDVLVPPDLLLAATALHPRTTLVLHDTAQHLLPLEDPQWVAARMQDWLETNFHPE